MQVHGRVAGRLLRRRLGQPRRGSNSNFLEPGDIDAALQTASAIGDDTLQRQRAGPRGAGQLHPRLAPSSASAGSRPASRRAPIEACNTFARGRGCKSRPSCPASTTSALHAAEDRGADGVRHARARRRQVRRDAGRADREGRPRGGGARHRHRRRRENPRAGAGLDRRSRRSTSIISTGGTGFTGRDVTPEAVEPLFEKRMDGFSTAFHMVSHAKIGIVARSSRARPRASRARPTSSACRARPAPAATPGTRSSCTSSTIATGPAISSR